ncbi:MAG: hypothetical protein A3A88_03335 [Nitrospirae bacterium RIFCSPLOWO2_01_FULL_62_17]|nr:MAG: hypothetical protein A3A88_03335 [Nitrospirae bacterium RIFCSPLOWO2_01_FULL_62_17]
MSELLRDPKIHAVLGAIVVTIGFWLVWGELPVEVVAGVALAAAGFMAWQGSTIGRVWAWTCLLLGLDSLAWPIMTMVQVRMATEQPTDQQMGLILTAVVAGLFSSVFWISFAFGIFRWIKRRETEASEPAAPSTESGQKKRR